MRYFIELSYNGTAYHGWQKQPNALTVQEVIEDALSMVLRQEMQIMGAGRTDTGVHATQIMAHFDFEQGFDIAELVYKMNSILPKDVAVISIDEVQLDTHARFHALSRSYEYYITQVKDPFGLDRSYYFKNTLDVSLMNEAAALLKTYTNFKCFSKSKTEVKTYNCTITNAVWEVQGNQLIFKITANRFLRNMVRAIVGTLIEVGMQKLTLDDLKAVLKSEDRSEAGYSVPAHGLYLTAVKYPKQVYK